MLLSYMRRFERLVSCKQDSGNHLHYPKYLGVLYDEENMLRNFVTFLEDRSV
jgi:hypothetical protein